MNKFNVYIYLLLSTFIYGQNQFVIKENGLTSKFLISKIDTFSNNELFAKTVSWIKVNEKKHNIVTEHIIENESIDFSFTKHNSVHLNKQYYNVKYKINISFEKEQFKFEPIEIQLKINSKYDMGWKDFELTSTAQFFKKGKVKRKYKTYLKDIVAPLNELFLKLNLHLKQE